MLREQRPGAKAYICYGAPLQGMVPFLDRIRETLRAEINEAVAVHPRSPAWPEHLLDPHRAFERMLLDEFGINALDDIPARILAEASWQSGRQTLLYVRHAPVSLPGHVIRTEVLKTYLEWCNTMLVPVLRAQGIFSLLCIPVQAEVPDKFRARLEQAFGARHLRLKDTYGYVLGEFQDVTIEDLHHFCDTHNIPLPEGEQRDKLFDTIIRETGGLYEPTLEALKDLERRYWAARHGPVAHETRTTNGDEGY